MLVAMSSIIYFAHRALRLAAFESYLDVSILSTQHTHLVALVRHSTSDLYSCVLAHIRSRHLNGSASCVQDLCARSSAVSVRRSVRVSSWHRSCAEINTACTKEEGIRASGDSVTLGSNCGSAGPSTAWRCCRPRRQCTEDPLLADSALRAFFA